MKFVIMVKDSLILLIISAILIFALSVANVGTKELINKSNLEAQMKAYAEVCPGYYYSEDITADVVGASAGYNATVFGENPVLLCKDESGEIVGYIVHSSSKGFNSPLNLIVGFDKLSNITGVRYANIPSETPGLGMKTTETSYLNLWLNHNLNSIGEVDTISGATVTSTAFEQAMSLACLLASRAANMYGE